jgi:hypothetical protein
MAGSGESRRFRVKPLAATLAVIALGTACSKASTTAAPATKATSQGGSAVSINVPSAAPSSDQPVSEARFEGSFSGPGGYYVVKPKCSSGACDVTTRQAVGTITLHLQNGVYKGSVTKKKPVPHGSAPDILTNTVVVKPILAKTIDGEWRVTSATATSTITSKIHGMRAPAAHNTVGGRIVLSETPSGSPSGSTTPSPSKSG